MDNQLEQIDEVADELMQELISIQRHNPEVAHCVELLETLQQLLKEVE